MKRVILILWTMIFAVVLTACGAEKLSDNYKEEEVITKGKQVVEALNAQEYQTVTDMVREDVKEQLSAVVLEDALDKKIKDAGAFVEYKQMVTAGSQDKKSGEDYAIVVLTGKYENTNLTYTISMNENLELVGLYMK